jgi:hypothetical protein
MIERITLIGCLWMGLGLTAPLAADDVSPTAAASAPAPTALATAQAQAVSGSADAEDQDVYYAPEESGDASGEMGASQGAVGSLPGSASYLSHARLVPFEWGHPDKALDGVELYLNGQFLGSSPLSLDGYMVQRTQLSLGARKDGYEESERANVKIPVEGDLRVALLSENAAGWYTTPAWLVGLGLILGAAAASNNGSGSTGVGLAGAGVGVIALSQLTARFIHLPALRRQVDAYNSKTEAAP